MNLTMTRTGPILAAALLLTAAGCTADNAAADPSSMQQRQSQALKDPFGYGPSSTNAGAPVRPGQSGQPPTDAGNLQKRDDSLKGEWNEFWNP